MTRQRVDRRTRSEGVVPDLPFNYASFDEADRIADEADRNAAADLPESDQNAAADLPEADQNAAAGLPETDDNADAGAEVDHADAGVPEADPAAGAPEPDAGPEAEESWREKLKSPIFNLYNIVMVGLLVGLNVATFYCMFAHGASEDEQLSIYKWEFICFALMDLLFVGNLFLRPHPDGCCYNIGMIILMLVCSIVLFIFGAMRASNDASKALKVLFAVVEVCLVLAQDGLLVGHLLITLD